MSAEIGHPRGGGPELAERISQRTRRSISRDIDDLTTEHEPGPPSSLRIIAELIGQERGRTRSLNGGKAGVGRFSAHGIVECRAADVGDLGEEFRVVNRDEPDIRIERHLVEIIITRR